MTPLAAAALVQVHHLKGDGTHVRSWGAPGVLDGQFNLPHGIAIHPDMDKVIVCDRENNREHSAVLHLLCSASLLLSKWQLLVAILVVLPEPPGVQIFTLEGEFVSSWFSHRACGVCVSGKSIYIAELGTHSTVHGFGQWADYSRWTPNIGNKISILTSAGEQVQRLGADSVGERPDEFLASLHSVGVNSKGDIYAAEVSFVNGGGAMQAPAREMQSLHKWERLPA